MDKSVKVEIAERGGNCEIITLAFTLDLTAGEEEEDREVSPMETVVSRNYTTQQQQQNQRGPRQSRNPGYRQCGVEG